MQLIFSRPDLKGRAKQAYDQLRAGEDVELDDLEVIDELLELLTEQPIAGLEVARRRKDGTLEPFPRFAINQTIEQTIALMNDVREIGQDLRP